MALDVVDACELAFLAGRRDKTDQNGARREVGLVLLDIATAGIFQVRLRHRQFSKDYAKFN